MLTTEISVVSTRTLGRGEETLLSSGWTLIGSELSFPNFYSSVRAERSFAIRYLNVVIKPICSMLDIFLNYKANAEFRSRAFGRRSRPKVNDAFSVALLRNLADFKIHFDREKSEHTNAPIDSSPFIKRVTPH